jgi:drug/metabolite transporter (DMT)-like permease
MDIGQKDPVKWILFIGLSFIWGSSFILMKEGMKSLGPFQVASIRILSAGIVLLPLAPKVYPTVPRGKWALILLSGLLGTFIPAYLFCIAETRLDSGLAGITNALTPLFTLLIGTLFFRSRIHWMKWLGVTLGLLGMVMLIWLGRKGQGFGEVGFAGFALLATIMYGINVNLVTHYLQGYGSRQITTVALTLLSVLALIILTITGFFTMPVKDHQWWVSTGASMLLGMMGTGAATLMYYVLLKRSGGLFSTMVTYGIPFVALFWGSLAGEHVGVTQLLCLLVILSGVLIAQRK